MTKFIRKTIETWMKKQADKVIAPARGKRLPIKERQETSSQRAH